MQLVFSSSQGFLFFYELMQGSMVIRIMNTDPGARPLPPYTHD